MEVRIFETAKELSFEAAKNAAESLKKILDQHNQARLIVATGVSQIDMLSELIKHNIAWNRVEMFHLDEYVGLSKSHKASFRKYIKDRLVSRVKFSKTHFINGEGEIDKKIVQLTKKIHSTPIDIALIGIGENGHIAFNDPPADFDTQAAYKVVTLDEQCKAQQVREGWFDSVEDVPHQAITMTVYQILQSKKIIVTVPYQVKAKAVRNTLKKQITNMVPASILKSHANCTLYLDAESSSLLETDEG